jgi:phenylalanyl-tRNA synthetase beta chain
VKVPISWLRDFVDVPTTPEQIAVTMSVRGFAVEGIEPAANDDAVLDFEILANRPDCMSILGIAREVATAYQLPLRQLGSESSDNPALSGPGDLRLTSLSQSEGRGDLDVKIDEPELCPRYVGAVADVKSGASPQWMQARLMAAGVRPISNVVDVTNYVLLELGHPMHAFDHARLIGERIIVRTARPDETIRTLDGTNQQLSPDMLLIADAERGVAVAGVIGGANSEIGDVTKTIVLESAYFNPLSVRRTSRALNLTTEASMRFERGADPQLPVTAMKRACALLEMIGAGHARGTVIDRYPTTIENLSLRLRRAKLTGLLGSQIPDADVHRILEGLGFVLVDAADGWDVTVPTRRVDAKHEVDLIEEVARHHGYDQLPTTFPALAVPPQPIDPAITTTRHLRTVLTAAGFSEAMTFGFIAERTARLFTTPNDLVPIANPLSENFAVLRPSLLPGLLDAVSHNRRRQIREIRLFETGACFSRTEGERRAVACVWTGTADPEHWSATPREVDFFDILGIVEPISAALGLNLAVEPGVREQLLPGRTALITANGREVGLAGQLQPSLAVTHGLPSTDAVYVAELWFDTVSAAAIDKMRVLPLARFPSVVRDVSILLADTVAARNVRDTIRTTAASTLENIVEFDRYKGKGVPDGKVSLSLRLTFRAIDRTLTDGEVDTSMDAIVQSLTSTYQAIRR